MLSKNLILTLPFFIVLAGCEEPQQQSVVGPSGQTMQLTKCSQSPNACYKKASETCRGGYKVLDSYSKAGGLMADILPGPVTWYYMTYQCGPSDNRPPTFPFRGQEYVPAPVVVQAPAQGYRAPTTTRTTCNRLGDSVTCNSY